MRDPEEAWTDVERDLFYAKQRIMELEAEVEALTNGLRYWEGVKADNARLQANLRYYEETLYLDNSRTAIEHGSDVATIDPEKVGDIVRENERLKARDEWVLRQYPTSHCPECAREVQAYSYMNLPPGAVWLFLCNGEDTNGDGSGIGWTVEA
jgi:hypothetical protein